MIAKHAILTVIIQLALDISKSLGRLFIEDSPYSCSLRIIKILDGLRGRPW